MKKKTDREKTILEELQDAERKIGLQRKLLRELEIQKKAKERTISVLKDSLRMTEQSYNKTRAWVARRIIAMYKRGQISDWEAILTRTSLSQAFVMLEYQRRISENDRRNLRLLEEKKDVLQDQNFRLEKELKENGQLIRASTDEAAVLEGQQGTQNSLLKNVRQDKAAIQKQLEEKRIAMRAIEERMNREARRAGETREGEAATRFATLKGKLDWPVKGTVVSKYGSKIGTMYANLGIDIKAIDREAVRAVCEGKVDWIMWYRGLGNVVVLDHGGGYETLYAYLDVVLVEQGEVIAAGEVIGHVGDGESLHRAVLNFQIWLGRERYDPETWLR
ncbi:MAG: peptidoglycan DD-metalloendopeptidase family protein [bacterium]